MGDESMAESDINSVTNSKTALKTDDETVKQEEEKMNYDGFSVKEQQILRDMEEHFQYEAEVSNLLNIIVNSLYSSKEIFLRELISNASDALDKIRFLSLSDPNVLGEGDDAKMEIMITFDKDAKTLTIRDRGIGMTKEELMKNLGTIAQSGSRSFIKQMTEKNAGDVELIGQFGVGFYSAYLVADTVTVTSKSPNSDTQYVWTSDGKGGYSIAEDPRGNTLGHGTSITLHLMDDMLEFADENKLKTLVKKYSEFINFDILLAVTKYRNVPVESEEDDIEEAAADASENEDSEEEDIEDVDEAEDGANNVPETRSEQYKEFELINANKPIWMKSPKSVSDEEYDKFYESLTWDQKEPLCHSHFAAEGDHDFKALLYVPQHNPKDLFADGEKTEVSHAIKLYVRRVFITGEFSDLMPRYLDFIKGVVDSDDIPLNVSREMLQETKLIKQIRKKLTRKALDMIKELMNKHKNVNDDENEDATQADLAADNADYLKFWDVWGKHIKLGVMEDGSNRTRLARLLRFHSSAVTTPTSEDAVTSLDAYISRMKPGQKSIYYIGGESVNAISKSPFLERLLKRNYEVLYLVDPIDEYALASLPEYEDYKLVSAARENLKLDGEDDVDEEADADPSDWKPVTDWLVDTLGRERVEKATISNRMETSPAVLVASSYGYTANMERVVKAQAMGDKSTLGLTARRNLEINVKHPIILNLRDLIENGDGADKEEAVNIAMILYDTCALSSGFSLEEDVSDYAQHVYGLMTSNLSTSPGSTHDSDSDGATNHDEL
jgi:heat shock protein beta